MSDSTNGQVVLNELRDAFNKICAAGDSLDGKLNNLLTFSSLIVSFAATIQISMLQEKVGIIFWATLIGVILLYVINFIVLARALNPVEYVFAIRFDRKAIGETYFKLSESQMTNQLIGNYLDSIKKANETNDGKVFAIKWANRLLIAIVILLLIAVPLGLFYPHPTLYEFFNIKP